MNRMKMSWIKAYGQEWRWLILVLLILAIMGPWGFDRINVPAEYDRGPTHIRLEGDFCGLPISMVQVPPWIFSGSFQMTAGLIKVDNDFSQTNFNFWIGFFHILAIVILLVPIINLVFLIWREDRQCLQKFHLGVCGVNFCLVLTLGIVNHTNFFYVLWGIWRYFGLMISILVLEGFSKKMFCQKDSG